MKKLVIMIALVVAFAGAASAQDLGPQCFYDCEATTMPGPDGGYKSSCRIIQGWSSPVCADLVITYPLYTLDGEGTRDCGVTVYSDGGGGYSTRLEGPCATHFKPGQPGIKLPTPNEIPTDAPGSITKTWAKIKVLYRD